MVYTNHDAHNDSYNTSITNIRGATPPRPYTVAGS